MNPITAARPQAPLIVITEELEQRIAADWFRRAAAQDYKPSSMKYRRAELEYLAGVVAAIDNLNQISHGAGTVVHSAIRPTWFIAAIRGENIFTNKDPQP